MHTHPSPVTQPGKRRRGRALLVTLGVLGALVAIGAAVGRTEEPNPVPPSVGLAQAPPDARPGTRDGKFEFTVEKIETGVPSLGSDYTMSTAQGSYVLVHLTVRNIGEEAQLFSDSDQKLVDDQDRRYDADSVAAMLSIEGNETLLNNINPGNEIDAVLVFDVPDGVRLATLELHDSPFSDGVAVPLGS